MGRHNSVVDLKNITVVDMDNFDVDSALEELHAKRYSMPPAVVAAFRQAGMKAALRLLQLMNDDDKFDKLRMSDKIKVMELIFDRAYGKTETASSSAIMNSKLGLDGNKDHAVQLDAITERARARSRGSNVFPELKREQASKDSKDSNGRKIVSLPTRPSL